MLFDAVHSRLTRVGTVLFALPFLVVGGWLAVFLTRGGAWLTSFAMGPFLFIGIPVVLTAATFGQRLQITDDRVLRYRRFRNWNTMDLKTMFEVRHYVHRRSGGEGTKWVKRLSVKNNDGDTFDVAIRQWPNSAEFIDVLHQLAADQHVPVIHERGSRDSRNVVPQPESPPTGAGGAGGYGDAPDKYDSRSRGNSRTAGG